MPRGGYGNRVKPPKAGQVEAPVAKPTKKTSNWRNPTLSTPSFLSRNMSETKVDATVPVQSVQAQEFSLQRTNTADSSRTMMSNQSKDSASIVTILECEEIKDAVSSDFPKVVEHSVRPVSSRTSSDQSTSSEDPYSSVVETVDNLTIEHTQTTTSSLYSGDATSIYSKDSASIYSSASSVFSSDNSYLDELDRFSQRGAKQLLAEKAEVNRVRAAAVRRQEAQDAAARERSTLVKKAAMFKNSKLPPQLPAFSTSLATWSMVCRAAHASSDCYDSAAPTRRGTYTPANTKNDIKAMIIDDQLLDDSRLVIVSIRGTEFKCLADWAVNKAADPTKPVGFMDNEENACHAGFLQVTKAMVGQIATQLQQHPATSEKPSLLFTGHSAGGAVASMLYSHMVSTSVNSELTVLASNFPSINCVTFGAPPLTLTPLPKRDHANGVFLSFANEGDPVARISNTAYVKSLAKLMTTSSPSSVTTATAAPQIKVINRSRGSAKIYKPVANPAAPVTPWEELPLWQTPPGDLTPAGDVILLRDKDNNVATASRVTAEELQDVIFADLAQHTIDKYIRRVNELALAALIGR